MRLVFHPLAVVVAIVAGAAFALLQAGTSQGLTENITVDWRSAVWANNTFCVSGGLHNGAYDLVAAQWPSCSMSMMYGYGWARGKTSGSSTYKALNGYIYSGQYWDRCDYVEVHEYDAFQFYRRGIYRYVHMGGPWDNRLNIWVSPTGYDNWASVGFTTYDNDCRGGEGWSDYHSHQDARNMYNTSSTPNSLCSPCWYSWNTTWIHRWTYTR